MGAPYVYDISRLRVNDPIPRGPLVSQTTVSVFV